MYTLINFNYCKDTGSKKVSKLQFSGNNILYIYLKQGNKAGEHYHTGVSELKNPEVLYLISGTLRLELQSILSGKSENIIVHAPQIIQIEINVYHVVTAITDCIFLEEYNEYSLLDKKTL